MAIFIFNFMNEKEGVFCFSLIACVNSICWSFGNPSTKKHAKTNAILIIFIIFIKCFAFIDTIINFYKSKIPNSWAPKKVKVPTMLCVYLKMQKSIFVNFYISTKFQLFGYLKITSKVMWQILCNLPLLKILNLKKQQLGKKAQ